MIASEVKKCYLVGKLLEANFHPKVGIKMLTKSGSKNTAIFMNTQTGKRYYYDHTGKISIIFDDNQDAHDATIRKLGDHFATPKEDFGTSTPEVDKKKSNKKIRGDKEVSELSSGVMDIIDASSTSSTVTSDPFITITDSVTLPPGDLAIEAV
jgi:hypothetical protein